MDFYGFQKLTLLDFPGKVACTVFTGGCNFRCPFCHNAILVTGLDKNNVYTEDEIIDHLKKRQGLIDGVVISGGEPLLHRELYGFIVRVKELGYKIKLDTNGSFPDCLEKLIGEKLIDYVAMDIKNCKERYAETAGIDGFDIAPVEKSIGIIRNSGIDYEFRTTVVKEFHTAEDIERLAKWISGCKRYFLQSFVDSGNLITAGLSGRSRDEMLEYKAIAAKYIENADVRGI